MSAARLVVCAPLWVEAIALRRELPRGVVRRTGYGSERSRRHLPALRADPAAAVAVAGVCAGTGADLRPGDVVVASEVHGPDAGSAPVPCPSAPLLAHALRRRGCRVRIGAVRSVEHVVSGAEAARLGGAGVLAVDLESATLAGAAHGRPLAVARVVVDTPARPLARADLPFRGTAALTRLADVGAALREWADAVGPLRLLLASPRSFCAGVERAIDVVERLLAQHGPPVYVRKQIVHNRHVVERLRRLGAVFVDELDEVPPGALTVFSAHGVSPAVRGRARDLGLRVVDATCPLVAKVHADARRLDRAGRTVVLVGHAGHEEVEGTLGELDGRGRLVESVEDVEGLRVADPERVAYTMQTTLSVEESEAVVAALRARFPAVVGPGSQDICYATSNRQQALVEVARQADVLLVVGSANSSNSRRLVEVAQRHGRPAHLVDDVGEVDPRWLAGARTVGISAGASAPPQLVDDVVEALRAIGAQAPQEHVSAVESLRFSLPKEADW